MDASVQIAIAAIGSVACGIMALVIVAILVGVVGEKQDTAAEDLGALREGQKTIIDRIERLKERPTVRQFLIVNSARHDIMGVWAGHIDSVGVPTPSTKEMHEELQKYPGVDIEILIMRRGVGSVLSAIPKP